MCSGCKCFLIPIHKPESIFHHLRYGIPCAKKPFQLLLIQGKVIRIQGSESIKQNKSCSDSIERSCISYSCHDTMAQGILVLGSVRREISRQEFHTGTVHVIKAFTSLL